MEQKQYVVKCLFRMTFYRMGGRQLERNSWAERIFLIRARDEEESYRLAEDLALEYECDYINSEHQLVSCRLYEISDSCELPTKQIGNGTELYTNFFDAPVEAVEAMLHLQYGERNVPEGTVS